MGSWGLLSHVALRWDCCCRVRAELSLQVVADEENSKDTQVKFVVSSSSDKRNRDKSLISFYLKWKNTNLIFWPSHLEIAAQLVHLLSGRAILRPFRNRRECCMALNNDKI